METEFLGVNSLVKPFWQNLPHFFTYPLSKDGLIVIGGYGLAFAPFSSLDKGGIVMVAFAFPLICLILFFSLIGYCNFLFHKTMNGKLVPPGLDDPNFEFFTFDHIKQVLVWVLLNSLGTFIIAKVPTPFNLVLYEVGKLLLPALFIMLIVNRSLSFSLNPLRLGAFIIQLGPKYYLLLYLFASLLLGGPDSMKYLFFKIGLHNTFIASLIVTSVQAYYLIILYHMLAYVVLQYHQKLGWEVDYTNFLKFNHQEVIDSNKDIDPLLNDARFLLGESKPEEALELIGRETKGVFRNPELALLFVKLLRQLGHGKQLKQVGDHIIELLFEKKQGNDGVKVYEQCLAEIPAFTVSPENLHSLADCYLKAKQHQKALKVGIEYIQRVPNNEKTPQMYLLLADLCTDKLSDSKLALQLITHFTKHYKGHVLMPMAKEKYTTLKKMQLSSRKQKES